ncbi:MAG: T9SS type A sorting domain-containing protein [Ignavibacteria bacterium]
MKRMTITIKMLVSAVFFAVLLNSCLIVEVEQSTEVEQNGTFTTTITVTDVTADATAHEGAIAVLVPSDWEFDSGTYDSEVGSGSLVTDENEVPVYGNLDSVLVPPDNMKWIRLLSDAAYTNDANVVHEATMNFTVGETTGEFEIGYMVTKNSADLLASLNTADEDSDAAWADTSMGYVVTVTQVTAVDDQPIASEYMLNQNYPNPFNPSTTISFTLQKQEHVKLTVYDALGNEITTLINKTLSSGLNTFNFDASNLSSGTYIYRLETESFVEARKMILLK